jgi:HPt (histidine-containing phosphotransfer) domain-containing protein
MISSASFSGWLDDFLTSYYRHRPVNATFIGVHTYDDRLPDFSRESVAQIQSEMKSLLARLRSAENSQKPNTSQELDRLLAGKFNWPS